ncbi:hypothetical protein BC940DRAFT_294991 [Gongronella butleri]|nr:hypothetical protein BC940DRAFT_294991 [Gongronella butleri]
MRILNFIVKKKNKDDKSLDLRKTKSLGDIQYPPPGSILVHSASHMDTALKPILTNASAIHPSTTPATNLDNQSDHSSKSSNSSSSPPPAILAGPSPPTPPLQRDEEPKEKKRPLGNPDTKLAAQLQSLTADNMEVLLSMETQARMDRIEEQRVIDEEEQRLAHLADKNTNNSRIQGNRKLKFALPDPPARPDDMTLMRTATTPVPSSSSSHSQEAAQAKLEKRFSLPEDVIRHQQHQLQNNNQSKKRKMWTKLFQKSTDSHASPFPSHTPLTTIELTRRTELSYGCKVKLIRSPLKTIAYVRYIGPVDWADGEWIGVELERAVGKNDGSVDGHRYFYTGANRGIFLTKDELMVV